MADLSLLLLTLLWGTTFHYVKAVLEVASSGLFLAARFGAALAALLLLALVRRERPGATALRAGALLGLLSGAGFVLQTFGLVGTTPARSAFLTGLSVLVVPFVCRFAFGRPVRAAAWTGVLLATVGLAVLTQPFSEDVAAAVRLGDALTLACALAFALHIALTSEWSPRHALVPLVLGQVAVNLLCALAVAAAGGVHLAPGGLPRLLGTAAFAGVGMTAGAFLVMAWAQRRTSAVRAALIYALEPVAAALFSHLYGGAPISGAEWAGGALVVLGVVAGEVGGLLDAGKA